jgi:hypothetical protein
MTRHALQDTSLDESPVCFCAEADTWLTLSPDHEEEWTQMLSGLALEGRATPAALAALFSAFVLCVLFLRRFLTSNVSLKYFDFFLFLGRLGCVMRCRVGVIDTGSSTEAADADDKLTTGAASVAAANAAAGGPASAAAAGCDADADKAATSSSASEHCDSATAPAIDATGIAVASSFEASAEVKVMPAGAASLSPEALAVAA